MRTREREQSRADLYLQLSLLLIILIYPMLDQSELWKLILLLVLIFVPVTLATVRLSRTRHWMWPSVVLMSGVYIVAAASTIFPYRALIAMKWGMLTAFFGLSVVGLFSSIRNARTVTNAHLYTAGSIYLLLGLMWFALYSAIDAVVPGAILCSAAAATHRHSELLYFSLVTLTTIGYGDVVPLHREVRILAALEGVTGILYVAITVAILVSGYRWSNTSGNSSD